MSPARSAERRSSTRSVKAVRRSLGSGASTSMDVRRAASETGYVLMME